MTQLLLALALSVLNASGDTTPTLFRPLVIEGERLKYEVVSARFGKVGRAELSTALVNGRMRISFDSDLKIMLFKASDHTVSELDVASLTTLSYTKRERSPIGKRDEDVRIDRVAGTWSEGGKSSALASEAPLDELSMINLVRSLRLERGQEVVLTRHFDTKRNPVRVRLLAAPADSMVNNTAVDVFEMRVPDQRQEQGVSVLHFYLSRDARREPVRIVSYMPIAGRITMNLQ